MKLGLDRRTAGGALVIGHLVVVAVFYSDPSRFSFAVSNRVGIFYFVLLPLFGLVSGVYAIREGPFSSALLFVAGNFLALFAAGFLASFSTLFILVGIVLFAITTVAVLVSLERAYLYLR